MKDVKIEDIAKDVKKITDEQLKSVQEKVNEINQMQMQIGGMEIQKTVAIEKLKTAQIGLGSIQKDLEDEYGKVTVNLTDGTIKPIEDESSDKKD